MTDLKKPLTPAAGGDSGGWWKRPQVAGKEEWAAGASIADDTLYWYASRDDGQEG